MLRVFFLIIPISISLDSFPKDFTRNELKKNFYASEHGIKHKKMLCDLRQEIVDGLKKSLDRMYEFEIPKELPDDMSSQLQAELLDIFNLDMEFKANGQYNTMNFINPSIKKIKIQY